SGAIAVSTSWTRSSHQRRRSRSRRSLDIDLDGCTCVHYIAHVPGPLRTYNFEEPMILNERARAILNYIRSFQREKGYPPTIREIGEAFEIHSTNGVRYHLSILEKGGYLNRRSRISRGTTTVSEGIPVLGRVAAGQPILAEESYEGSLEPG